MVFGWYKSKWRHSLKSLFKIIGKQIVKQKFLKCTSRKTNIKERKIGNYKL